jgi:ribosomal protein RSM22 (predicted rRNA methylase)
MMELPPRLRRAIEQALSGMAVSDLAAAAANLSRRYRDERREERFYVANEKDALAYLAVRLPATYAAIRASFAAIADARPDFAPATALDAGAGPGTALLAAADAWPDLADALLVEASRIFSALGKRLVDEVQRPQVTWHATWHIADIAAQGIDSTPRDLVCLAYVLNELAPEIRQAVVERLWALTADILVIVEPGTPAGWQRILEARRHLIAHGAHVIAPCPHADPCPLQSPDWCHFAQRVARSRLHRQAKRAEISWEDEKFSYIAVSRSPLSRADARVIARPRKAGGHVTLKLCRPDGSAGQTLFSRRDGALFKRAWRSDWGSSF